MGAAGAWDLHPGTAGFGGMRLCGRTKAAHRPHCCCVLQSSQPRTTLPAPPTTCHGAVFKPHHGVHYGGMHYGHGFHGGFKHKGFKGGFKRPKFGFKRPKFGFKRPKFGKFGGKWK